MKLKCYMKLNYMFLIIAWSAEIHILSQSVVFFVILNLVNPDFITYVSVTVENTNEY
jgi:hypothetical protein